jgi:hypothetical protein
LYGASGFFPKNQISDHFFSKRSSFGDPPLPRFSFALRQDCYIGGHRPQERRTELRGAAGRKIDAVVKSTGIIVTSRRSYRKEAGLFLP